MDNDPVYLRVVEMRQVFGPGSGLFDCFSAKSAHELMITLGLDESQLCHFFWDMEVADKKARLSDSQLNDVRLQLKKKGFLPR